jgi:phage shock protein A
MDTNEIKDRIKAIDVLIRKHRVELFNLRNTIDELEKRKSVLEKELQNKQNRKLF